MPAPVMATTVDLATTINKPSNTSVTHTPPPTLPVTVTDNAVKDTGRSTTATQSYLTNKNKTH